MSKVTLTCNCGKVYEVEDCGFPGWVRQARCNFCIVCEDHPEELYTEWYEPWNAPEPKPDFVDPNQLNLFEE